MTRRRRLPRILLNATTAVSLVLGVATGLLWVRSYAVADDVLCYGGSSHVHRWWSANGRIIHLSAPDVTGGKQSGWRHGAAPALIYGEEYSETEIPYWLLAFLIAAVCALARYPSLVAARRARADLCPACGYDLRATPDRCPECGTIRA